MPAFDNIVRFTDHAEASYFGCTALEVVGCESDGTLILRPINGYAFTDTVYATPTAAARTLNLFAR